MVTDLPGFSIDKTSQDPVLVLSIIWRQMNWLVVYKRKQDSV